MSALDKIAEERFWDRDKKVRRRLAAHDALAGTEGQ